MPTKSNKIDPEDVISESNTKPVETSSADLKESAPKEESYGNGESENGPATKGKGVLEVMPDGYGFLRANGLSAGPGDIYISQSQIRRFDIRPGDEVEGKVRPPKETERYFGMLMVEKVNDLDPDKSMKRPKFSALTSIYPNKHTTI